MKQEERLRDIILELTLNGTAVSEELLTQRLREKKVLDTNRDLRRYLLDYVSLGTEEIPTNRVYLHVSEGFYFTTGDRTQKDIVLTFASDPIF